MFQVTKMRQRMATKPVRIDLDTYEKLEREAVRQTTEKEKIIQISTVANDILKEFFASKDGGKKKI